MIVDRDEARDADLNPVEVDRAATITVADALPSDLVFFASAVYADEGRVKSTPKWTTVSVTEEEQIDTLEMVGAHVCLAVI